MVEGCKKNMETFSSDSLWCIALVAESKPLEVSLRQRCFKFSTGIDKYGLDVLKTVVNVAQSNHVSVYCNNYVEITGMCNDDLNVCYNMIMNNWCNSISGEVEK